MVTVVETSIPGVVIIEPKVFADHRGYFFESYAKETFDRHVGPVSFIQDNEACSTYGVLRGLHYQLPPYDQAKLVRVISGKVIDVALDIRKGSPTYMQHVAALLSGQNKKQMFIPRGCAHGYAVLSKEAVFAYKVDNVYAPQHERGIRYDDESLHIDWQLPLADIKVSSKDIMLPPFSAAELPS